MTRNLALCMVPTVIAVLAIYWFRKKKKMKSSKNLISCVNLDLENQDKTKAESSTECTSDAANTLSDASSFTSPVSSEKSLRTNSPVYSPLLNDISAGETDINDTQTLPNCIDKSFSGEYSQRQDNESYDFHSYNDSSKLNGTDTTLLNTCNSEWNSLNFENNIIKAEISKFNNLQQMSSRDDLYETVNFPNHEESDSASQENCKYLMENCNHVDRNLKDTLQIEDNCFNSKVLITDLLSSNCTNKNLQTVEVDTYDSHSSVFDENSLSYISDDSESKQLAEYKNKGSLSSVLDENSLLSSVCDELKSTDSNSPPAVISQHMTDQYDSDNSEKDILKDKTSVPNFEVFSCNNESIVPSHKAITNSSLCLNPTIFLTDDVQSCNQTIQVSKDCSLQEEMLTIHSVEVDLVLNAANDTIHPVQMPDCTSTLDSNTSANVVQNILTDLRDSFCDNSKIDIKSFDIENQVVSDSGVEAKVNCDTNDMVISVTKSDSCAKTEDSIAEVKNINSISCVSYSPTTESNNMHINDLSSITVDQQLVSSECSIVFSDNSTFDTVSLKNSSRPTSESLSDSNSSTPDNAPTNSNLPCCIQNSPISSDESECGKNIQNYDSNNTSTETELKLSETEISKNVANKAFKEEISSESTNWEEEEGHAEETKQRKLDSNGVLDAKTPPQPAGEFVYEFELPQELCGRLIGKHGRNVKSIKERSNANVFIKRHPYDPQLKIVVVEGSRSEVNEALEIIRRKYPPSQFPTVTLVQTNVISSTGVSLPESLQLHLPEGTSCDVILSSLVSAGHFFLQQPTHPTYPSLSTLDQCMINLYSQMDTPLLPQPIEAGVICAAPVCRGWYRAQVVYVCENTTGVCGIKFVDYGGFSEVTVSSLRQIRSDFMSLPFQASECYLANVRPVDRNEGWSAEATSTFEEIAQGQILQAQLVEYADDGIPCVYLYRVQGVSSTFINKELVERGLAVWVNSNHWDPH